MPLDPLRQPPLLHNQRRFFQLDKFAADVAAKELEFAANVGAFEEFGRGTGEGGEAVRGGEGGVEFRGCGAEFFGIVDGGGVDEGGGCRCLRG